jgi:hypothetical protein
MIPLRPGNGRPLAHNRLVGGSSPPEHEISPNPAISPESAGLPSEILSLRRRS